MKNNFLILALILVQQALFGQLSLSVNMTFEPDPDVLAWSAHPETVQLTVTNSSDQTLEYKYAARLIHNGQTILDIDLAKMPTETIGPFETRISFAEDVFPANAVDIHGSSVETYMNTNTIPGGQYQICVKLVGLNGQELSPDNCRPFQITMYQQPALIFPTASSPVAAIARPVFSWSPVIPMPQFPVTYRLRVVEVPDITRSWVPTDEPGYYSSRWGSKEWMPKLQAIEESGGTITEYEAASGVEIFYREDRIVTGVWKHKIPIRGANASHGKDYYDDPRLGHTFRTSSLSNEALRALNYGFPLIDVELANQTQYQWPIDLPDPLAGRTYVWSVQALRDDNGLPIGDNNGLSQPAQFYVTDDVALSKDAIPVRKAPEFIIADENGCLYGCTGNVWQPIDCPTERSFSSPDSYPFSFLLISTEEGSERKWLLADETTVGELVMKGPMLPINRFALADNNSFLRTSETPYYLNPTTAIITGGGGIKLCWSPDGCIIVDNAEPCPDIMGSYLVELVTTPNTHATNKKIEQPAVTLEQLQPFLIESVIAKAPMYLSLNKDGQLTKVNSGTECTGDYCLSMTATKDSSQTDEPDEEIELRRLICWLDENPNGMFPVIRCFDFCHIEPDHNTLSPMVEEDVCIKFKNMKLPDLDDESIVLRTKDGSSICLKVDGSIEECGSLPSEKEITKAVEELAKTGYTGTIQQTKMRNDIDLPAGLAPSITSNKYSKATLDFIKGMPVYNGANGDDWTEIETSETIILCVQNGKVSPINSCRNCPGNCLVLKKILYHGSESSFAALRQIDGGKECLKCKKGDCPDHNIGVGKPYFPITGMNADKLSKVSIHSIGAAVLLSQSPQGDLQVIQSDTDCPPGHLLFLLESAEAESMILSGKVIAIDKEKKTLTVLIEGKEFMVSTETMDVIPELDSMINFMEPVWNMYDNCEECKTDCPTQLGGACFLMPALFCVCFILDLNSD